MNSSKQPKELHPNLLTHIKETPPEISGESKNLPNDHPFAVNSAPKHSVSEEASEAWQSSTAKLGKRFSASENEAKDTKHDDAEIQDDRVYLPSFVVITHEPAKNPIKVVLYGNEPAANKKFLANEPCRISTEKQNALVEIKKIEYKLYYSLEKCHPSIIFYFPSLNLPLANLNFVDPKALYRISYEDWEDAQSVSVKLTPSHSFVNEHKVIKCDQRVADNVLAHLLITLRRDHLMTPKGLQLTSETKPAQSNCCS